MAALERQAAYLATAIDRQFERRHERLLTLARARPLRSASWILGDRARDLADFDRRTRRSAKRAVEQRAERLRSLAARLAALRPRVQLERAEHRIARLAPRLLTPTRARLTGLESRLAIAAGRLEATSPYAVLERGYSITRRADGSLLRHPREVAVGEPIETQLAQGILRSRIESVQEQEAEADE